MKTLLLESIEKEIKELLLDKFNWKTSGSFDKLDGSW